MKKIFTVALCVVLYNSAKEMYEDFSQGLDRQIIGMIKYIENRPGADSAIRNMDYAGIESAYNGGSSGVYAEELRKTYMKIVS
jgi:hypothetical protein